MKLSHWDKFLLSLSPDWTMKRLRSRRAAEVFARHYEAASSGDRTTNWNRTTRDANSLITVALEPLRTHARDLLRNNSWARRGQRTVANNTVGWGFTPKAFGLDQEAAARVSALWKSWAGSTACDFEGRLSFSGLCYLAMRTLFSDGEVLIRKHIRPLSEGLPIPLKLQLLEADLLDHNKNREPSLTQNRITNGVEFDADGKRAAYWVFPFHPGGNYSGGISQPIPASEIIHVFDTERAGQARGVSWLASAIVNLKELDEYEDAELVKQKIAACFAGFVTDTDGLPMSEDGASSGLEELNPGSISYLPVGKEIQFATPPAVTSSDFPIRNLRKIAAGLGVSYEDLTGDYSQSNFSSARMARLAHWGNVWQWQFNMMIPQFCQPVWDWAMSAAWLAGLIPEVSSSEWSAPPMPMIEPDKEGLAAQRLVRTGMITPSEMVRQQGSDPEAHWREYAADLATLDALKIKLDSDVRAVSQAGLTQERVGIGGGAPQSSGGQAAEPVDTRDKPDVEEVEIEVENLGNWERWLNEKIGA